MTTDRLRRRIEKLLDEAEQALVALDWQHDSNLKTEVEVRFIKEGKSGTRVELEHRHLDRYGARRDQMRGIFDSDRGWGSLLASFARAAEVSRYDGYRIVWKSWTMLPSGSFSVAIRMSS